MKKEMKNNQIQIPIEYYIAQKKRNERMEFTIYLTCLISLFLFGVTIIILKIKNIEVTELIDAPCGFYTHLHLYCPGCGGTRAVKYMLHGNILYSLWCHPFVLYSFVLMVYFTVRYSIYLISKKRIKKWNFKYMYIYIDVGLLLGQWIIKNILLYFYNITIPN